jgi:hypothetical protein
LWGRPPKLAGGGGGSIGIGRRAAGKLPPLFFFLNSILNICTDIYIYINIEIYEVYGVVAFQWHSESTRFLPP